MELAQAVREAREARGWSQAHLARKVGAKSRAAVNKIEMGRTRSGETVLKVLALLAIDLNDIDLDAEPHPVTKTTPQPPAPQHHPGVEALAAILRGDRDVAITDADLDDLRTWTLNEPIATPGEALDIILARRRAQHAPRAVTRRG